jgi:hypothetical protein
MNAMRTWVFGWLVSFIGFPLGGLAASLLVGRFDTSLDGLIGGAISGLVIGSTEYIALRQRISLHWMWIVATSLGLSAGVALGGALFGTETTVSAILLRAPIAGLMLGLAQWLVLRHHVRLAALWVIAVTLIFTFAWFVTAMVIGTSVDQGFYVFGASGAIVYQVLTALVLALLHMSPDDRTP